MQLRGKKILFLVTALGGGGAERVSSLLCEYMHNAGYNVELLETEKHRSEYAQEAHFAIHSLNCDGVGFSNQVLRLIKLDRYLRKNNPDILISLGCAYEYLNLILKRKRFNSLKLVLSERNYSKSLYSSRRCKFYNEMYNQAAAVVFQTEEQRASYDLKSFDKTHILPNPLMKLDQEWAGGSDRVVTACRLVPQKNLPLLLEAFSLFKKDHGSYSLNIYGDGPLREGLMKECGKLGIDGSVSMRPFTADVHEHISAAGMFVSSSNVEGLQNSLVEAVAMGVPCVATDCDGGGARLILDGGRRGILVPKGDARCLAEAMGILADDKLLARKLSAEARGLREVWAADRVCASWVEFLERV